MLPVHNQKSFTFGFAAFAALSVLAALVMAQQQPAPVVIKPLRGGVYYTQGGIGGNSGIIVGQNGVIVIDAKTTPDSAKEMLAEIAKLTPKPVTHVILTHSDLDHVNGLAGFPTGLTIIAHENNKKEQEAALRAGGRGAPPADHQPTRVVTKNKESLELDGVKFTLLHWEPAHTSGDLAIYLSDQKVVFTGDLITTLGPYPLIHREKNGTGEGWVESVKGMIALDADTFVTGHGELQTKGDLQKKLAAVEERRAKIKEMIAQGKSLDEVKQAFGEAAPPGSAAPRFPSFTETQYQELSKK
jgi:cyclase